jgi:hypothetical protein
MAVRTVWIIALTIAAIGSAITIANAFPAWNKNYGPLAPSLTVLLAAAGEWPPFHKDDLTKLERATIGMSGLVGLVAIAFANPRFPDASLVVFGAFMVMVSGMAYRAFQYR